MVAIKPTIRNGSAITSIWERIEIRTVCRISTGVKTMSSSQHPQSLSSKRPVAQSIPKHFAGTGDGDQSGQRK